MIEKSTILICPLDWGIGHASRLITIINSFINAEHKVIIAGSGKSIELLKENFPSLIFLSFTGYNISYSKTLPMSLKMAFQIPKILKGVKKEKKELDAIIDKYNIDIVLSDNRFGLWTHKSKCIYITHQIMIKMPCLLKFMEYPIYLFHKKYINKYDECWIPDIEKKPCLAGDLTTKYSLPNNAKFIGPLSRFSESSQKTKEYDIDILIILSGPEPQRTIFENILVDQISKTNYKTTIIRGLVDSKLELPENIKSMPHINSVDLQNLISKSKYIICRSGYSSIMDLIRLKRNAILVPTPGQTEQEYLAKYYQRLGIFYSVKQKEFNLKTALNEIGGFTNMIDTSKTDEYYSDLL